MKKKRSAWFKVAGAVATMAVLGLLAFVAVYDEPPPDVSDLALPRPLPLADSFHARMQRGDLALSPGVRDAVEALEDAASRQFFNTREIFYVDSFLSLDGDALAATLAKQDPQLWANLDAALTAPRERVFDFSWMSPLYDLARLLHYQSWHLAQQGNADAGMQLAVKILELGQAYAESEAGRLCLSTANGVQAIGCDSINRIARHYRLSPECLREAREAIRNARISDDCVRDIVRGGYWWSIEQGVFSGERGGVSDHKRACIHFESKGSFDISNFGIFTIPYVAEHIPNIILWKPNKTKRMSANLCRQQLSWIGEDLATVHRLANSELKLRGYRNRLNPDNALGYAYIAYMGFESTMVRNLQVASRLSAAEAGLAVLEYEMKHGGLPEKLDDLVPEYLPSVPLDYLDKKPIRYAKAARAVWSIGLSGTLSLPLPRPEKSDEEGENIFRLPELKPAAPTL